MSIDKMVALIGWPVSHSLSPSMHNAAFKAAGLNSWLYLGLPVSLSYPHRLKEALYGLRALGFVGANVTVPYKEAVMPYMDRLSEAARAIGAVNTIEIDAQACLIGHNTDGDGFVQDLRDHGVDISGMSALVLGAGGSARAITHALLSHRCKKLGILNRTQASADGLAAHLRQSFKQATICSGSLDQLRQKKMPLYDLVINCTSLGMKDSHDQMPWDAALKFVPSQVVYDLIYNPSKTSLLTKAEADGARIINGLGMLVHQGALSFTIWTGRNAPIEAMKSAARFPGN